MAKRNGERGEGGFKVILFLAVVVYLVFMALKIVPAKSDDSNFEHKVEETLRYASTNNLKDAAGVKYQLMLEAKKTDLTDLLKNGELLTVTEEGSEWHVVARYHREIPLLFWKYERDVVIDKKAAK